MSWKWLLGILLPMLEAFGWQKVNEDENEVGKDDIIGQAILFGVKIFRMVLAGDTEGLKKALPTSAQQTPAKAADFNHTP